MKERFPHLTAEDWFEGYVTSVTEVRQIVDWAGNLTELNAEQVGVIGISLGGFIAAISMGIDKRINAGVFVVAGGNYENPAWMKKKRDGDKEADYQSQNRYAQYLTEVAEKGFENVAPVKESYLTDPMTFAHYLRQRPILMINALWDVYIPREATLDFWEACGKPTITWIPATHSTIWLGYPFISKKIASFLNANFPVTK
jgi:cephalosporin-C deacetylase-like acetyl esterase